MFNLYSPTSTSNNRKLQFLLETKLSTDEKVPKTGRLLRNKIFVIGFPPNCTELDLEKFFSNFGLVRETRIVKDDNGVTKGFAFITFAKERSVVNALEYRAPLYFMDRKLSINPAIKKQHPLIQSDRCLSSSTSIDTPSDSSTTTNNINHRSLLTSTSSTLSMMYMPIASHSNGSLAHPYYNTACQPFFHFRFPSHPIYSPSTSGPLWHPYYSTAASYPPSCTYFPMANTSDGFPVTSAMHSCSIYPNSMIRYSHVPPNNKIFS